MATILGIDMGVSSIGWSLIDDTNHQIIGLGSRIFQAGVNVSPLGKEESKNVNRRNARQIRRQIFRKAQRQELLLEVLQYLGWLPANKDNLDELMAEDPYKLRKNALDQAISLPQLGRIFYHLSKRRGFKSSRKSGGDEEGTLFTGKDDKIGISELQSEVEKNGSRSIGAYFSGLNPHEIRIRNRYILRNQYVEEFDAIWAVQVKYHPEILKPLTFEPMVRKFCSKTQQDLWLQPDQNLYNFLKGYIIYYQRPLKSQKGLVGKCKFETAKKRCPKSALPFQEFRIWQKLHDIKLTGKDKAASPLSLLEKEALVEKLNTTKELTIEQMLKMLGYTDYEVNFRRDDKIKGNRTAAAMISVFGKKEWAALGNEEKTKRWKIIYDAQDNDFLVNYGIERWNLSQEQADKLKRVNFEGSYAEMSQKAIQKILPLMTNQNLNYVEACAEAGYHHSQKTYKTETQNKLPEPPNLRNPIVNQGLFELRNVVNEILEVYSVQIDEVHLELARELKMPKKERESIAYNNKKREGQNDAVWNILKTEFPDFKNKDPKPDDLLKYKLWEECQQTCVYSGKQIAASQLFSGAFEIEHIYPKVRSGDDSFQNKTLCDSSWNRSIKENRIPFEMLADGKINQTQYDAMVARAKTLKRNGAFNFKKFERFVKKAIPEGMVASQLNDTAYLSVQAGEFLKLKFDKVQVSTGTGTAKLRGLWGLNSILNRSNLNIKNRDDHRHHALDALVIACTTLSMVQKLARLNEKQLTATKEHFEKPWPNFRNDAKDALSKIFIAHRYKNRVRGKLHDETMYGRVKNMDGSPSLDDKGLGYFKVKKPIESLTAAMIFKIAGPVREVVLKRLADFGAEIDYKKQKVEKIPAGAFAEKLLMPNTKGLPIPINKVTVHDVSANKIEIRKDTFVDSGNNHHIVIFEKPDGKKDGKVCSLFEATQRKKRKEPVINKDCGVGNEFAMALSINEMVLLDNEKTGFKTSEIDWQNPDHKTLSENLYRVQAVDSVSRQMTFRHHLVAILVDKETKEYPGRQTRVPNTLKSVKVVVSSIGEIALA